MTSTIPKNPGMSQERDYPHNSYAGDGIGSLNPILGRDLDS